MDVLLEQLAPYLVGFIALWLAYSRPDMAMIERLRARIERLESELALERAALVLANERIRELERINCEADE